MATAILQVPHTEKQGGGDAARFTRRYWDRFDSANLTEIRKALELVLDERARQYDLFGEPPAEAIITPAKPELVAQTTVGDLAGVLSPSQVACWLDCQAKWYFRYFRGLPDVVTASRALGTTLHRTMAVYWRTLIAKDPVPEVEAMLAMYDGAWKQACEQGV